MTIEQVIKPPKGQRIRFSDAGVKFPAGTMATLVLKAEGTKESTEFDLTFVKSFGTVAVFRSSEQGFFVAYGAVDLGVVQFMPPVRSDFVPFSNYTSGMTLTAKDIISIWKTRFDSVIGASLTQLAQQSEEVQAERCESLVNIPHTAAGTLLKKLSVSRKPEVAKKAREALLKWNEINAAISVKPVQPTPKPLPPKK